MDRISEVLKRVNPGVTASSPGTNTLHPQNIPTYNEFLTPEQQKECLRLSLWLSSADHTFENFKVTTDNRLAFIAVKTLAEGKSKYKMALIYGHTGNGKTYLCEATALYLHSKGIICRVLSWPSIVRGFKRAMDPDPPTPLEVLVERYCTARYLIVDDIGAGMSGSEFGMKELDEIVSARYHDHLFTLMTTNKDITELPERAVSRFRDNEFSRFVLNKGEDYRPKK